MQAPKPGTVMGNHVYTGGEGAAEGRDHRRVPVGGVTRG